MFPRHIFKLKDEFPGLKITQVIPVIDDYSIEIAKRYDGVVDFLLLDSFRFSDSKLGATGETHDWNISLRVVQSVKTPVILAGGLGPENVAEAIRLVHPAGVNSKTRTDTVDGTAKDLEKSPSFCRRRQIRSLINPVNHRLAGSKDGYTQSLYFHFI